MNKVFDKDIEEIVKERISVRTYKSKQISNDIKDKIKEYIKKLNSPFDGSVVIKILENDENIDTKRLGTYGVIKGATNYIATSVKDINLSLESLGYQVEKLVLYITSLGLGTCWLAGTFNKSNFREKMEMDEGSILPIVVPFGYSAENISLMDKFMRFAAKSSKRKEWEELFFNNDFSNTLKKEEAREYSFALEMLRLAPSGSNAQPWKILKKDNYFHFYRINSQNKFHEFDVKRIDIGIAACHFHLAIIEKELNGEFIQNEDSTINVPENLIYAFSWKCSN